MTDVFGPGAYLVQPGGAVHTEVNTGQGELVALVYFEGPVDYLMWEIWNNYSCHPGQYFSFDYLARTR